MRRTFWTWILLASLAGSYLLTPRVVSAVQGVPTFTVTPSGEYGVAGFSITTFTDFSGNQITSYCNFNGVANFSGGRREPVGTTGTITISAAATRCNGILIPSDPGPFFVPYQITGANEFEFFEPGNEARGPLHGRTLSGGDVLLLDGTKRFDIPAGGTGPLLDYATMVRP